MEENNALEPQLDQLGDEVHNVDEEVFDLFSYFDPSQDLGMVDAKAEEVYLSIAGKEFTIKQSPGVLRSDREGGTTGAAVWRASVHFAEWLAMPDNPFFMSGVLGDKSTVLELGSGIAGLVPLALAPKVSKVIATDQQYALRLLQENIKLNLPTHKKSPHGRKAHSNTSNIDIASLDWENDDIDSFLQLHGYRRRVDVVVACDCIFNYALITPLIETCTVICRAREKTQLYNEPKDRGPTLCIVAQQLRQPEVFEQWLQAFIAQFRTWRVRVTRHDEGTEHAAGFVIHVGLLRQSDQQ